MPRSSPNAAPKTRSTATKRVAKGGTLIDNLTEAERVARSMSEEEVQALPRAPLARFAAHPLNPPHRHEDPDELAELVASIKLRGVLSPAIVVTRAELVARDPDMAAQIPENIEFVFLDGHRRWGASTLADVPDMPYIVRDDLADPGGAAEVFLASNIHRQALSAIEEARGYERLAKAYGLKQTQLAARVGVSQGEVSKSMALLKLPEPVQKAIEDEQLSPNAARALLDITASRRLPVFERVVSRLHDYQLDGDEDAANQLAKSLRQEVKRDAMAEQAEKAQQKARETLRHEHLDEIDPATLFGSAYWRHELQGEEVEKIRSEGGLAGGSVRSNGTIVYYSIDLAPRHRIADEASDDLEDDGDDVNPEYSNGISQPKPDDAAEKARKRREKLAAEFAAALAECKAAHDSRIAAITRLIADKPEPAVAIDILADQALGLEWFDLDEAIEYANSFGVAIAAESAEAVLAAGVRSDIQRLAVAAALGTLEYEAASQRYTNPVRPWPVAVARHVQRLADLGYYEISDYDKARLTTD